MKRIGLLVVTVVLISCSYATAQQGPSLEEQKKKAKNDHQLQPVIDDPGEDCYDYYVNILTLKDNNHRIYWKQFDCIRIHTRNNPFIFKYDISFNEQLIPEDDPLGTFAGKFGLKISSNSASAPAAAPAGGQAAKTQQQKELTQSLYSLAQTATSQNRATFEFHPGGKLAAPLTIDPSNAINDSRDAFQKNDFVTAKSELLRIQGRLQNVRNSQSEERRKQIDSLDAQLNKIMENVDKTADLAKETVSDQTVSNLSKRAADIHAALEQKQKEYTAYAKTLPSDLKKLIDASADVDAVRQTAVAIRDDAAKQLDILTDQNPTPGDFGSRADEDRLVALGVDVTKEHKTLAADVASGKTQAQDSLNRLEQVGRQLVFDACSYKSFTDSDVSSIKTGIIDPIDAVLNDPLSFGYIIPAKKREGPWADPESVTMTITRTSASPFAAKSPDGKTPVNTSATFDCSTDTTDLFEFGDTYSSFKDFFADKLVTAKNLASDPTKASQVKSLPNLYMQNSNNPKPASTSKNQTPSSAGQPNLAGPQKTASSTAADSTVLTQQWLFGKARLVVSGGLSTAFLRKQEFQRSSSISGSTSSTVIGLKTDTIYRNTPMLYGHVLLYSRRHDSDAWYGTFGVTANSDTQGTDPEFLLGFSRSFAHQRFFFTGGAYLGERQKLDGGLMVGQTIPSTLTGDLPVTKSYHVGGAIGISFRLASTKNPQSNTPSKPATTPTKP
jgi:hypothetical protein